MNSEELEQSLRTEFESYLKDVLAEMKQEVSEFQEKIESEFEKHRTQLSEVIEDFAKKIGEDKEIGSNFQESVTEHLKLARDEGARITAAAIAEAEEMQIEPEAPANFSDIRDAINEISGKDSQSEILKSLVHHASQYTSRGAFFIVKNKHLVGWRVFGTEEHPDPEIVKEVYFPITANTSLGESVDTLGTVASGYGIHADDSLFLEKLGFGEPSGMYAIPLVVRGRGVAVLYADRGMGDGSVNVEALESLIRVSGLTVDVIASSSGVAKDKQYEESQDHDVTDVSKESELQDVDEYESTAEFEEYSPPVISENEYQPAEQEVTEQESQSWNQPIETTIPDYSESVETASEYTEASEESIDYSTSFEPAPDEANVSSFDESSFSSENDLQSNVDQSYQFETPTPFEDSSDLEAKSSGFERDEAAFDSPVDVDIEETSFEEKTDYFKSPVETDDQVESSDFDSISDHQPQSDSTGFETMNFEVPHVAEPPTEDASVGSIDFDAASQPMESHVETVVDQPVSAPPTRSRFGDRNVDLPIEVEENERRHHNDARRFARLLVSEIKLYNEQKVKEGRESSDLYERLREAIDRSREMYDKRVQPPVAAKFDYFNYELVNTLAEGEEGRLGGGYPGANV